MAMELPRFSRLVQSVRGSGAVDVTAGVFEGNLADTLAAFSASQAELSAARGIEQAALEGAERGALEAELPEASDITAAGRAFNEAAQAAHLSGIRRDIKTRLTELAINARDLPAHQWVDAFVAGSDGFREGLMDEVDARFKGEAFDYYSETAGALRLKLLDAQQGELREQVLADLALGQGQLQDDINTAAREGNLAVLTKRQREYEAAVTQAAAAGLMTEAAAQADIQGMHSSAVQNEIFGAFDSVLEDEGIEAAAASLNRFNRADASALGLSSEEKDGLEAAMRSAWDRARTWDAATLAQNDAAEKAARANLRQRADDATTMLKNGRLPESDINALAQELTGAEEFGKFEDLANAVDLYGELVPLLSNPPSEQRAALTALQGRSDLSADEFRLSEALEGIVQRNERLIENDPRALAREQRIIVDDPELNLAGVDEMRLSLTARVPATVAAGQHYELEMPIITNAEAERLGRFWSAQDVDGKLAIANVLAESLGPGAGAVLGMIDDKGHRELAYAGGLTTIGETETAAGIIRGAALLSLPDGRQFLPEGVERAGLEGHIDETIADSFAFLPETALTVKNAALAWYADRQSIAGGPATTWDRNQADAAVRAVLGNVVEDRTGGAVPLRGADQNQFDRWLDSIDANGVLAAGGVMGFEPAAAADRVRGGRLIAIAEGRFRVAVPDPFSDMPQFLLRQDGRPFEIAFDPEAHPPERPFPRQVP